MKWKVFGFCGGRKTGVPGEQQTQPTYDVESFIQSGNRTGPHWWEASALTTAPPLLPRMATRPLKVTFGGYEKRDAIVGFPYILSVLLQDKLFVCAW